VTLLVVEALECDTYLSYSVFDYASCFSCSPRYPSYPSSPSR